MFVEKYLEKFKDEKIDYLDLILENLSDNLIKSNDNPEIFHKLLFFLRDDILLSILNKSKYIYTKSILIPSNIYNSLSKENKETLINIFPIRFTENTKIVYYSADIDIKFVELTYHGLLRLIKVILNERNSELFNLLFKKIKQLSTPSLIIEENDKNKDLSYYQHTFSFTVLSWLFYLYQNEEIEITDFDINFLDDIIASTILEETDGMENLFNSYYRFKEEVSKGLYEIAEWDINPPPIGVFYFTLLPNTWLDFGWVLILLKYNTLHSYVDITKINSNKIFRYEVDEIENVLKQIEEKKAKYIDIIIPNLEQNNGETIEELFKNKKETIINFYKELKKKQDILFYKEVAETPLSEEKVEKFKSNIGHLWDKNNIIPQILKYYDRVIYKENDTNKDGFGIFTMLVKMKFAFIDGENYQSILGLTDFGPQIAKLVNDKFFKELDSKKEIQQTTNLLEDINIFLSKIKDKSKVIIITNYKGKEYIEGKDLKYIEKQKIPFVNYEYKDIPIIIYPSHLNQFFIINLNTIEYTIYQNDSWYNKELLIEVNLPTQEQIDKKIEENKDIEDISYLEKEIKIFESASVNLKILFKSDITIKDVNSYVVYQF